MKRGKYIRSKEQRDKLRQMNLGENNPMYGKKRPKSIEERKKISESLKGRKLTEEHRKKIGKRNYPHNEEVYNWGGGSYKYWHNEAWNKFGKDYCVECGMTNEEHLSKFNNRLHMHCEDHIYSNLIESNWKTVCVKCHGGIDG